MGDRNIRIQSQILIGGRRIMNHKLLGALLCIPLVVLRATLRAMGQMAEPGCVVYLPFEWTSTEKLALGPPVPPPIAQYLLRHPWALPRFLNRTPPVNSG